MSAPEGKPWKTLEPEASVLTRRLHPVLLPSDKGDVVSIEEQEAAREHYISDSLVAHCLSVAGISLAYRRQNALLVALREMTLSSRK